MKIISMHTNKTEKKKKIIQMSKLVRIQRLD